MIKQVIKWFWANKWHELGHPASVLALAWLADFYLPMDLSPVKAISIGLILPLFDQVYQIVNRRLKMDDISDIALMLVVYPMVLAPINLTGCLGVLLALLATYMAAVGAKLKKEGS